MRAKMIIAMFKMTFMENNWTFYLTYLIKYSLNSLDFNWSMNFLPRLFTLEPIFYDFLVFFFRKMNVIRPCSLMGYSRPLTVYAYECGTQESHDIKHDSRLMMRGKVRWVSLLIIININIELVGTSILSVSWLNNQCLI